MRKWIINVVLAALAVIAVPIGAAAPASASTVPVVYTNGMGPRWSGPAVRSWGIDFGAHYAVEHIGWSGWYARSAFGRGRFYQGLGIPSYVANVELYNVKTHNGHRYFSWIKITATGHKTRYLSYDGIWHTH